MTQTINHYFQKYTQAQLWLQLLEAHEAKKKKIQMPVNAQEVQLETIITTSHQPQVVFTQVDRGHNEEEKKKIQRLYQELGNIFISSSLKFNL